MCFCVFLDPVNGKHQIAIEFTGFAVIKRDDVGVVIVVEVRFVHFEQVVVRAENDGNLADALVMCTGKIFDPRPNFPALRTAKRVVGIVEL